MVSRGQKILDIQQYREPTSNWYDTRRKYVHFSSRYQRYYLPDGRHAWSISRLPTLGGTCAWSITWLPSPDGSLIVSEGRYATQYSGYRRLDGSVIVILS